MKGRDQGRMLEAGETVNIVSFFRGNKYAHTDIVEAKFCGNDDNGDPRWEIVERIVGGSNYGGSLEHSIDTSVLCGAYGPEELREWIDKLRALKNPVWFTAAWFCPIYRRLEIDALRVTKKRDEEIVDWLNKETNGACSYCFAAPPFEFRVPQRKQAGEPFPHGWDGGALAGFLYDYLSSGRKEQIVTKQELCVLTGADEDTVAAFIENGAVPLAVSGETAFDCKQLANFLVHAFTKCWNGYKFVWGHQWKMEKSKKPNAVRISGEDWFEVNYEARGSGVYLLFKDSRLKYVGESSCVMQRVANHYGNPLWGDFDRALYRPVAPTARRAMEKHYTRELCPQFDPHRYGSNN